MLREAVVAIREIFPDKTLGKVVFDALTRRAGLSETSAQELGQRAQRIGEKNLEKNRGSSEGLRKALAEVVSLARVDYSYDIPALAGYAKDSALKIYIDRGLKREWPLANGRVIDVAPYLTLHEVMEKSLLDEVQFKHRGYQYSHQIAQRLEQEAVRADGFSWKEYQYQIMVPEGDRAYTKPVLNLPPDLDTTPYRDLEDLQILKPVREDFFTVSKISEGMFYLRFDNATRMAATMMRFQEYYESPEFAGKYFTREEFVAWYAQHKAGASYVQDWRRV